MLFRHWYFSKYRVLFSVFTIQLTIVLEIMMTMRESIRRQVDKKSGGPQGERGLEFSRRKKEQTFLVCIPSVQFSSVAQSFPTLCDPMNRSTPGLPVHHQLPEFTSTHVHRVGDAIQPSNPLSSPYSPAPSPFQHQGLFQ